MQEKQAGKRSAAPSVKFFTIQVAAVLIVLHVMVVVVMVMVGDASASMSKNMSQASAWLEDVTSLQAGSSLLTETATTFILTPVMPDGSVNTGPLAGYINELSVPRRGADVLARFEDREISPEAREALNAAAESAAAMFDTQMHALSLVCSVYHLPDVPPFTSLPLVALTDGENAMPQEARLELAQRMIISQEYSMCKQVISQKINECVQDLRDAAQASGAVASRRLIMLRTIIWAVTGAIMLTLIGFFFVLYRQLVNPLRRFYKLIDSDDSLDETSGLREVRTLASAYNGLLKRRDDLDAILRSAAETDALTNLPNRYRFEQYLVESTDDGKPMTVFLFDINYLKQTNDTKGHLAGDKLIRDAAECISEAFGDGGDACCFRFGGDEFAAILRNCGPEEIEARIRTFRRMEAEKGVSISMGYAHTRNASKADFKKLLNEADRKMYDCKKAIHSGREAMAVGG